MRLQRGVAVKHALIGISICLVIAGLAGGQDAVAPNSIEHPFAEGGLVNLRLSSGDYTIRPGRPDRIAVQWRADKPSDASRMRKVNVTFDTSGYTTTIHTDGPLDDARVVIEIPARSDLNLRIFAGDVRVEGILGDKDIKMTFGDLNVDASPAGYSQVQASVRLGDLSAQPFRISTDGIGQAFEWKGSGPYRLRARLFAGDLTLN